MPPSRSATILLVDDEPLVREVVQRSLELKGYPVITAGGGAEGVARFMRDRDRIDIVVADIKMPDLSGPEMVERIRREAPEIHVLFISGNHDGLPDWARETCGVLQKPFTPTELIAAIEDCLGAAAPKATKQ